MTEQERYRRQKAVKLANSINLIEGVPVSKNAELLSKQWANGEISGEKMKEFLILSHKRPKVSEA